MVSGGSVGNNRGGVDGVSDDRGGVDSVSQDGSGVHGMVSHGVDSVVGNGVDGVVGNGVDSVVGEGVGDHGGVDSVRDNGGSVVGGEVASGDEGSSVADSSVVSHVSGGGGGGKAEEGGDNESLKHDVTLDTRSRCQHSRFQGVLKLEDLKFVCIPSFLFCRSLPTDVAPRPCLLYIVVSRQGRAGRVAPPGCATLGPVTHLRSCPLCAVVAVVAAPLFARL